MNVESENPFNVFLIGYRCTGKSSVGKLLSVKLGWAFVDTDSQLVAERGLSISAIVDAYGWEIFRQWERKTLKQVCTGERRVVATGGGICLNADNVKLMQESGKIIWLRANPETIRTRMRQDDSTREFRPALNSKDSISEIEDTLFTREPCYRSAMDFYVKTDHMELDAIVDSIIVNLNKLVRT